MVSVSLRSPILVGLVVLATSSSGPLASAFVSSGSSPPVPVRKGIIGAQTATTTSLYQMKRPLLDTIASTLFNLETARVKASSEVDEQGRVGEPMAWSESNSWANQFSQVIAGNELGYRFKQGVADLIAGDYDREATEALIQDFIQNDGAADVCLFSFSTCPFCRRAKDYLEEAGISYRAIELDELSGDNDNQGNEIRASLGRLTRRTSVPSIFVRGQFVGGCNDGPGLLPLAESGELQKMLQ